VSKIIKGKAKAFGGWENNLRSVVGVGIFGSHQTFLRLDDTFALATSPVFLSFCALLAQPLQDLDNAEEPFQCDIDVVELLA